MTKPRINKTDLDGTPKCPHCGGDLWQSTVTIAGLMEHWPIGGWLAVGDDGYAREDDHLTTHCGECRKPVAIGFSGNMEDGYSWTISLAAARTKKDDEFLNPDPMARFFDKALRFQVAAATDDERAEPKEWR